MEALKLEDWSFLQQEEQFVLNLRNSSFTECIEKYCEIKKVIHPSVVGSTSTLLYHIRNIERMAGGEIYPRQITSVFYSHFIEYLHGRGLKQSTIINLLNCLRSIVSWSSDFNAEVHPSYKTIDIERERTTKYALTADEVSRIYHFDLSNVKMRSHHRENLQRVKDMFVLGCNLGQRHSDLIRITADCFTDGKFRILQQKTKNKACVDISTMAIDKITTYDILERYGYTAPYTADISNYNKHIKELMKIIFGDEKIIQQVSIGHVASIVDVYKFTQIASHTARRTFATYNYLVKKIPAVDVMKATGHTSDRSFHMYICGHDD